MKKFLDNISFPVKLILLGLIPLAFLLYFAIQIIIEKQEKVKIIKASVENLNRSVHVNHLAAQLHLERRASFAYILDKSTSAELILQRGSTNDALQLLEKQLNAKNSRYLYFTLLSRLEEKRALVLHKQLSVPQTVDYYSNVLERLQSLYGSSSGNIEFLKAANQGITTQSIVFDMINQFGVMRALVYHTAISRQFNSREFEEIEKSLAMTLSYAEEFKAKASKEVQSKFDELNKEEDSRYVNGVLNYIQNNHKIPQNFDSEKWWTASGMIIDNIIRIQAQLIEATRIETENVLERENEHLMMTYVLLLAIVLLVILAIILTIKNITENLDQIRLAAEKIAVGETAPHLEIVKNDVIGSLATSIRVIDINSHQLAKAALSIGQGKFDVSINPRSDGDILGTSLLNMKDDLERFTSENNEKLWIQNGITQINDAVRGEKPLNVLSNDVLHCLVEHLDANVGLFYTSSDADLILSAGYALAADDALQKVKEGKTLLGEAARKKQPIYIEDVPDNYLSVSSGIGQSKPNYLMILPLVFNDNVEGVIELGSLKPFSQKARLLSEQAARNIAIALGSSKSRTKLQALLEETQAQSEELQAQHSELEGLNTELEAQTHKLQASEEELKVQQEELLQANEELEQRSRALEDRNQLILERNLDIQRKAEELELSSKYKSEFLANMSHELRTPLNSILLLSRLMYENPEKNLNEDQLEYAKVIQSSGNGLLALIDEILDLSKIEAGKMDLEYADVYLKDIATDLKSLFNPIAKEKNLSLKIDINADAPARISTDRMRVEQILKNLISNALKFTSEGGITVTFTNSDDPKLIEITVIDTGIGIPKDKQPQIFEAFQQADGSTKRKFGGTGLGLSISRELARLLGGEILLKSSEGEGSEFKLLVPVSKIENKTSEPKDVPLIEKKPDVDIPQTQKPPVNFTVREIPRSIPDDRDGLVEGDRIILIIEDDTNFAAILLRFARSSGYKGIVAVRGDEGVEMAKAYNPLAILLDLQLPIKDGWQVMEELKSNSATRHIPVHMMSSLDAKKESLVKGAVDFINKPVAIEHMRNMFDKLEEVLSKHPKKVLIIEENPKHAQALAYYLEGFQVSSEITGTVDEGIDTLLKKDSECVILDMGIPDNQAYQTLDNIKKQPGLENIPIIVFTGRNLSKIEEKRLKQYADSIVIKTAHSYQRILDEVALFLHLVEEKHISGKSSANAKAYSSELNDILKGKTVLIADDDVRNIFSLTKSLEQLNMNVISATDGKEALQFLQDNPQTDIVLMDIMMPEMDGFESIKAIRSNFKYRDLPIIAVTAKAMTGDREKCIQAGASDYISKPVDIDQLISLLRVWLYDKSL